MSNEIPENKTREQQAMESLERMRSYWARSAEENEDIEVKRWKALGKIIAGLVVCAVLVYGAKLVQVAYVHVRNQSRLNEMTAQISQIVENLRQAYATKGAELQLTTEYLLKTGIVSPSMIGSDGELHNSFGGKVVLLPSVIEQNVKPAFKLSYQGLPHMACVALAQMDWGTAQQGLRAVALGVANDDGYDKALEDIDGQSVQVEPQRVQTKDGRWVFVQPRNQYLFNVARPNDRFQPTPFSEDDAIAGCACGGKDYCSFAVSYTF